MTFNYLGIISRLNLYLPGVKDSHDAGKLLPEVIKYCTTAQMSIMISCFMYTCSKPLNQFLGVHINYYTAHTFCGCYKLTTYVFFHTCHQEPYEVKGDTTLLSQSAHIPARARLSRDNKVKLLLHVCFELTKLISAEVYGSNILFLTVVYDHSSSQSH